MSNKIQAEWNKYCDAIYPDGTSAIQQKECCQAFFSGAAIALEQCSALASLPEDKAVAQLKELFDEVMAKLESFLPEQS